jgi:cobalt/nickel transport protein
VSRTLWVVLALAVACVVALALAPFASSSPDGLETVARGAGFEDRFEQAPTLAAPLPGYEVPGVRSERGSTLLAGTLGALATGGALTLVGWLLTRRGAREGLGDRVA